jgi:ribosomal-protein-alanine N-acetyltransferase
VAAEIAEVPQTASGHLADIHATAFEASWTAAAFADLLGQTGVFGLVTGADGFILCRVVADEAEILTLAVRSEARRRGLARALVHAANDAAKLRGSTRLFLEVAEDNTAAISLYRSAGFASVGRRRGYYPRPDGSAVDALVLAL